MKLFLIDAYALIYRSYYAFIKNPRINSKGVNTSAIFGFINSLEDVLKRENPTHIAVAFDPKGPTFRHEAFEQYKAQREETPEVIRQSVPIIKEIIEAYNIPILEVPRYEADDVIGTVSKQAEKEGFEVYMMTPDKDYGQLVSEHIFMYRPKFGGDYEIMGVPEVLNKYGLTSTEQVIDLLGLMGDASDNIPGCPGVGEKTAQKLLTEFGSIENLLANTDKLKGAQKKKVEENAEQIHFSKFLATIKTDVPIEFDAARCVREKPNEERLTEIYTELEFRTFINKLSSEPVKAAPKGPVQGDLFAIFTPESTEEPKKSILTDLKSTPHNYYLTDTEEKQADLARFLLGQEFFAFDTETDGIDPLKAGLVGMSFAVKENEAWYVPVPANSVEAAKVVERFSPALQNPKSLKIGQNIKFDILVLRKYNVKVAGPLFDTMIAHYLLNPELRHGMDYLAETYLKYQTVHIEELIGPKGKNQLSMRNVPVEQIAEYAAEDADITLKLKNYFAPELKKEGLESLFTTIEMPLIYVLVEMEATGVTLDTVALKQSSGELTASMNKLEPEVYELAGTEFNINSTKQVGEILFDRLKLDEKAKKTKTGGYSTSEDVLEKLRSKHPIIGKLLEYRGLKKLLSTYIDALPELINPQTGKIHTSFNQAVTSTGRLSSTNPNLQNIPVRDDLVIINPYVEHTEKTLPNDPMEYIVFGVEGLAFSFSGAGQDNPKGYSFYSYGSDKKQFINFAQLMMQEFRDKLPGFEQVCHGLLQVLLVYISRKQNLSVISDSSFQLSKECALAKRYIDSNYSQNITLDSLAEITHINKFYLAHSFTECVGQSPINYLTDRRLEACKELLVSSNLSVAQVATSVGFSSQSYFSQIFHKKTGMTPRQYRSRYARK